MLDNQAKKGWDILLMVTDLSKERYSASAGKACITQKNPYCLYSMIKPSFKNETIAVLACPLVEKCNFPFLVVTIALKDANNLQ